MIDYIKGDIIELHPTETVLECNNIGYKILISLQTFTALENQTRVTIYIHHHLREDEELYYGFATKDEREMFRLLISVSGIGAVTARMMLSSLTSEEIRTAILSDDVMRIKSVKGIGLKTAQRLILELKDKVVKGEGAEVSLLIGHQESKVIQEATTALVMLGFAKPKVTKVIRDVIKEKPDATLEAIIKICLQRLS